MKRSIGTLIALCAAGTVLAQAPFTIVRPADGSRVREKVNVLIPKNSIPSGGYVGVFLNGKFIEATVPPLKDKYYVYTLDTKGRGLEDGKYNLELVLYVDFNENPRIVDRSSISMTVGNRANIPVPASGVKLRYNWAPGKQLVYNLQQRVTIAMISQSQAALGGRPAEAQVSETEKIRLLYAVDNSYGNGDGLLRMQALPEKGKDFAVLTTSGDTEPRKFMDYEMHPIYMRVTNTGHEVFGSVPKYFAMDGTSGSTGESVRMNLYATFPLPTLPTKPVKPGDSWQSRFQQGEIDLEKLDETKTVVEKYPARGEFLGVEWEMGHPCAKIQHSIAQGTSSLEGRRLQAQGREMTGDDKIQMKETIWFALDRKQILKIVRDITVEQRVQVQQSGGGPGVGGGPGGGGAEMGGGLSGNGGGGRISPPGTGSQRGGRAGGPADLGQRGGRGGPAGVGEGRDQGGLSGGRGGQQGGNPGGRQGGNPSGGQTQFVRTRFQSTFILEK